MRYLVTGATGFIGSRVVRQLRSAGHDVVALIRNPSQTPAMAAGTEIARGDVTDKASITAAMSGCDRVFHIAGWYKVGVRDKSPGVSINVDGTRNVLEAMKELRIAKGVYTSSLAVNSDTHGEIKDETYTFTGTHVSEYDRTKAVAHDIARGFAAQGLPLVIVQPGMVYGPGDLGPGHNLLVQYLTRKLPMVPRGAAYCWAHVDDVAHGHILAMERGVAGENYFLAGPIAAVSDVLKLAEKITHVPAPKILAPSWALKATSAVVGIFERVLPVPENYSSEYLRVSAGVTYLGSNAKSKHALGWVPRPLDEGMTETLQYEMKNLGMNSPALG